MVNFLTIIGCILLLPVFTQFISFLVLLLESLQQLMLFGLPNDPKLLAGAVSREIVTQVSGVMLLIPGIIICSFVTLKYAANQPNWYRSYVKVTGVIAMLTLPVMTVIGLYLIKLSNKRVKRKIQ